MTQPDISLATKSGHFNLLTTYRNLAGRGFAMVIASELRAGMAIRIEGEIYKVLEAESKAGAAKLGGVVKTKLRNVTTGRAWGPHFRPQERLEDLELEQHHGIPIQRRRHLYFH